MKGIKPADPTIMQLIKWTRDQPQDGQSAGLTIALKRKPTADQVSGGRRFQCRKCLSNRGGPYRNPKNERIMPTTTTRPTI